MLHELGFSSKLKGFTYLKDIIEYAILNDDKRFNMNDLYHKISIKYNSKINNVAKCITEAINKSIGKANLELMAAIFGYSLGYENNCPTNLSFVCSVVDYLKEFNW